MTIRVLGFFVGAALVTGAASAAAQTPAGPARTGEPIGFLAVNGGMQVTTATATSSVTYKVYGEDARMDTTYKTEAGPVVGARAGIRVWRRLTLGAGVSLLSRNGSAAVTAKLPHPFYFQRPRDAEGSASAIKHDEAVVYGELGWMIPLDGRFDVMVFAGPAFFNATQEVAVKVQFSENYPFDTARFTSVESESKKVKATGFTIGADIGWRLGRSLGVTALIRYARATARVSPVSGQSFELDLGGLHTLAGVRIRF